MSDPFQPLPYRWSPLGARFQRADTIVAGQVIPFRHVAYRVVEVREHPENEERPLTAVVMPVGSTSRDDELHLEIRPGLEEVYADDHYPICASCSEPLPCREQMAETIAARSAKRMEQYEIAGVCPACSEPVTARQASHTFMVNLEVLGGPDVTFHLRRKCRWSAVHYEQRLLAVYPEHPRWFSCPGHVTNHNDGTYQCSELTDCPGPQAAHRAYTVCRCPDCHARGSFDCHPRIDARRIS